MQVSNIKNNHQSFSANYDRHFLDAADAFYKKNNVPAKYKQFCCAVRRFTEVPNSDNITISYKKELKDGKQIHSLYAKEADKEPVLLTQKDLFRKLLEKFSYMKEYEFKLKTGLLNK